MERDWVSREPGLREFAHELRRLTRRARRRPLRTLALALAMCGFIVWAKGRREPGYTARLLMRVQELGLDETSSPLPREALRAYLADVVLNKSFLLGVMERHDLHRSLRKAAPSLAIRSMWDDLDIRVYRNQFVEYRDGKLRSARIVLRYTAPTPQLAVTVVDDMARRIQEFEATHRSAAAEIAVTETTQAAELASVRIQRAAEQLIELQRGLRDRTSTNPAMDRNRIATLQAQIKRDQDRLSLIQKARAQVSFRRTVEEKQLGLRIQVIDRAPPPPREGSERRLIALAIAGFLLGLPIAGFLVGAFDPRIYELADLRRLDTPILDHIPGFPGYRVGGLRNRQRHHGGVGAADTHPAGDATMSRG
jgi:hypothetical protein